MSFQLYTTYYSETSICTGKVCSEGWFIWLEPPGSINRDKDQMICHIINDIYNTSGQSHGYLWRMMCNSYINGWLSPHIWYKTKEEATDKALNFIIEELARFEKKNEIHW